MLLALVCLLQIPQAYTTWDRKEVPPLPLSGLSVVCSTATQLHRALRTQRSGTTIVIKDGAYDVSPFEPLTIDSNHVTIRGMSGDPAKVILTGKGFNYCGMEEMIILKAADATLASFTISEVRGNGLKLQTGNNHNCLLYNMRFLNIGERMIKGPGVAVSRNWEIRYCHFEDTKVAPAVRCGESATDSSGDYIAGMDIMNSDSWVIHDCVFRNIRGPAGDARGGIFFWGGKAGHANTNVTVERNTFIGCDRAISFGNPSGTSDINGGVIRNNFIVRGCGIGIEMEHCTNVKVLNNTLYSSDAAYFRSVYFDANPSGNEFRNNIIFGMIKGNVQSMANNINKTLVPDTSANWFANITTADLHLTAAAAQAINTGTAGLVIDDWDHHARANGQCDIGADEYGTINIEKELP